MNGQPAGPAVRGPVLPGPGRRGPGRRGPSWWTVLLVVGLAVQLAPLLLMPWVLSQDGPAHVDGAWVLLHHGDHSALGDLLRKHYTVDLTPVPNMLTTGLLALLLPVLGPTGAEKAVVAGFVLLLVAGLGYALRGVDRRAGWLAVAALPLAGSELVAYGFYNFCWAVALALFAVGLALRRRGRVGTGPTLGLAAVLLLTWTAHLLPWLVAALVVGGLAVGHAVVAVRAGRAPLAATTAHVGPVALALLPSGALSAAYVLGGNAKHGAAVGGFGVDRLALLLSQYRPLVVASWWELVPALLVAGVLAGLGVTAVRRPSPGSDGPGIEDGTVGQRALDRADRVVLGAAALAATAAFLLSPARLGDEYGFLPDRLAWFPPLFLVLFCATRMPSRRLVRQVAAGCLVLAATAAVLVRLPTELRDQRDVAELMSAAAQLPPGSTFAVLRFVGHEAALAPVRGEPDPLQHVSSRLAVAARGVDVGHYEAVFPYFQVRFTPTPGVRRLIDPGLGGLEAVPPTVDLAAADGELDYVLVVGLDRAESWVRSAHRTARVVADLRAGYQEVWTSRPTGYVQLWRFRSAPAG